MKKYILIFTILFSTSIYAEVALESLVFNQFTQEIISHDHVRFLFTKDDINYKDLILNLQIKDFDSKNLWSEKDYQNEVNFSLKTRKKVASFLGLGNYQITSHSYQKSQYPKQILNGSFEKKNNETTYFKEINLYLGDKLYQFKFYFKTPLADDDKVINDLLREFSAKLTRPSL